MSKINNPVVYDSNHDVLIKRKLSDVSFRHEDWGNEDLKELRKHIRNHYRKEQKSKCVFCKKSISLRSVSNANIEHIAPKSKYIKFLFTSKNLCVACADCNEIKGVKEVFNKKNIIRYPRSSSAFKIVHPHFDKWSDYITKTNDGYYVGKDDLGKGKGSYTIFICGLNRELDSLSSSAYTTNGNENEALFEMARLMAEGKTLEEKAMLCMSLTKIIYK